MTLRRKKRRYDHMMQSGAPRWSAVRLVKKPRRMIRRLKKSQVDLELQARAMELPLSPRMSRLAQARYWRALATLLRLGYDAGRGGR